MRCSAQPVLAASRITLPVLGGISGCTRTMLNMRLSLVGSGAGVAAAACARRPRPATDRAPACFSTAAVSAAVAPVVMHVVDERDDAALHLAAPPRLDGERAAHVGRALLVRQCDLVRRVLHAQQQVRVGAATERARDAAGDLPRPG